MDPDLTKCADFPHTGLWSDASSFTLNHTHTDAPPGSDLPPASFCFATSGSTGEPSWVVLSKAALLASAAAVNRHLHVTRGSRWGLALPIHHVGGFGVLARAHEAGCGFACFPGKWNPQAFARWLAGNRITHTSLVPTQVHDLVAAGLPSPRSLAAIVVGGGRLEKAHGQAARALGWPVLASYGMTETASQVATQSPDQLPAPYDPDRLPVLDLWQVESSDNGCLSVSGPALFSGWMRKQHVGWIFEPRCGEWHTTSDRVELTEGPCIRVLGRADDLVKVLGELVSPVHIESRLMEMEPQMGVGTFVIVAVPDARAGHRLVPVMDADHDPAVLKETILRFNASCPGYERLAEPEMVGNIPRSPLGKILRRELAARLGT